MSTKYRDAVIGYQLSQANISDEGSLLDDLRSRVFSYTNLRDVHDSASVVRSHIRYLAALFPNDPLRLLAEKVHAIIDNKSVSIADVRLILDGRSLADASRRTHEVPFEKVQQIGALLSRGETMVRTAHVTGVSIDTVESIDRYIGISDAIDQRLVERACDAVRDKVSVRKFASKYGISKSRAHRYMQRAKSVLVELGEVL